MFQFVTLPNLVEFRVNRIIYHSLMYISSHIDNKILKSLIANTKNSLLSDCISAKASSFTEGKAVDVFLSESTR